MQMDSGPSTRIYYLAKSVRNLGHEIHIIIPGGNSEFKWSEDLWVHRVNGFLPGIIFQFLSVVFGILRPTSLYFYDFLFVLRTFRIMQGCDLVQIEQPWAAGLFIPFLSKISAKPLIVDSHDVFQSLRTKRTIARRVLETFLERVTYQWANVILTVSEEERMFLTQFSIPKDKILVIANGVDTEIFAPSVNRSLFDEERSKGNLKVIFMGNMEYWPNTEALTIIESKIVPNVLEQVSEVEFLIVGRGVSKSRRSSLIFTGTVEDVRDYLNVSHVAIAPLRHGSGTRLKILEYFSCALPVVSTPIGVEGLDVEDGVNVLIEDDIEEFAKRLVELLMNRELREQLGSAARNLVVSKYDWKEMGKQLDSIYYSLLA